MLHPGFFRTGYQAVDPLGAWCLQPLHGCLRLATFSWQYSSHVTYQLNPYHEQVPCNPTRLAVGLKKFH